MHTETLSKLSETKFNIWKDFLGDAGLTPDTSVMQTALIWDDDKLVATGSRDGNILKCIAVDNTRQGEGLLSSVITPLKKAAFEEGHRHLFLYTKPKNQDIFSDLFFYPVAKTQDVLLMEDKKDGIKNFLNGFPDGNTSSKNGCIVMNCNPFTKGHLYLIETAAKQCDTLYIFVVSEDKSRFSSSDRMEMVKLGTSHIPNVCVLPTGPYLISSATFPTYFLKDRENAGKIKCLLDIEIFTKYYAPKFNIQHRFVGTEPFSEMTNQYNVALKDALPEKGIDLTEIERLEIDGTFVSASIVRQLIDNKETQKLKRVLPESSYTFLKNKSFI